MGAALPRLIDSKLKADPADCITFEILSWSLYPVKTIP